MGKIRWGLVAMVLLCSGCLVSKGTFIAGDDDDDTTNPVTTLIRLLEWRLGGFGPGIPDRLAVFFRTPYADPVEDYMSDQDGVIVVMTDESMINLAVEAPHGQLFYLLPHLGNDALNIAHPGWPPPTLTLPLHVMFDGAGTAFDGGTVFGGGGSTVQAELFSGLASAYDLDLQERNFHPDGSVTLSAVLGPTLTLRAAIQQFPDSGGNVTLDQDFAPFELNVTATDPAVTITEASLVGHVAGADVPLNIGAEVGLPLAGSGLGLDVFESYTLEIDGVAADFGGIVTGFNAGVLLDPVALGGLVDPTAGSVNFNLDTLQPIQTGSTTGDDEIVRTVSVKLGTAGTPVVQIISVGTGGDTPVVRLSDETRLQIEGHNTTTDQTWTSTVSQGAGPIVAVPDITITDVQVSGNADEKTVDADWVIHPTGCNAVGVHPELHVVSDWFIPFYADGVELGCYAPWATSPAGGGTDESITVDFFDTDAAVVGSTSSTLDAGAAWTLGSESPFGIPTAGDTHTGTVHTAEMSASDRTSDIIAAGLHVTDGAVVVPGEGQPDTYVPQYFSFPGESGQPYQFVWQ